jgi:hypothetical protein
MSPIRTFRWLSMGLIAAALALAVTAGTAGAATSWGELGRFGGVDKKSKKGHKFLLEEAHAFGIDPTSNTVYVGDEKNEIEANQEFRLQQYNEAGTFEAEGIVNPGQKQGPPGLEKIEQLEGIAIDSAEKRLYLLVTYARSGSATIDPEVPVAGTLYAFSTTAVGGKLVPAAGTKPGGVVAEPKDLNAESEVPGKPLLNPSGLTVDPATHEVLILGQVDKGPAPSGEMHVAIDRVSTTGTLVGTWEDPTPVIEEAAGSNSPVASTSGRVYFESENQIMQVPQSFAAAPPKPVFTFAENSLKGVFHEEILKFGNLETFYGGALAIQNEGADAGMFFAYGEGGEMDEAGKVTTLRNIAIGVKFTEEGETVKTSELGWTGGAVSEEAKPCAIEFGGHGYTQVAMGGAPLSGNAVFALTSGRRLESEESEVVKFGPGGGGCPGAVVKEPIEPTINGGKVKPDTTTPVTLVAKVQGANVLSTKWSFGDGTPEATETAVPGQQSQAAEMNHKFAKTGTITVQATIVTDDLATPEIKVSSSIEVTGPGLKITQQPASRTVVEGEPASFEVKVSGGEPPLSFQWETRKTETEGPKAVPGATGEKLSTPATTVADSGTEYRVTVTPSNGKPVESSWAKLKVVPPAPPKVVVAPSSVTVTEGQTASFEATASGAPEPKIQWEVSSSGVTWAAVPGAEAAQLVISHATTAQNGLKYRALFTNEFAGSKHQATSPVATLTINAKAPSLPPPLPPPGNGSGPGPQGGVQGVQEHHMPVATISGLSLTVNAAGGVPVKISCPAGETVCSGTVTLRTLTAVSAGAHAAKTKSKKAILTLASASFSVSGGSVKVVTLHLSAKARRLLARAHKLRARATVLAHDPAGASNTALSVVTLTLAKAKHKH